jgi:hypothetical protein
MDKTNFNAKAEELLKQGEKALKGKNTLRNLLFKLSFA